MTPAKLVMVTGGGEIASSVAYYLKSAHLPVGMVMEPTEAYLRRPICFFEATISGNKQIGNITAVSLSEAHLAGFADVSLHQQWQKAFWFQVENQAIPVFFRPEFPDFLEVLKPAVVIKTLPASFKEIQRDSAELVIGLHPFHQLADECHIAVEVRLNDHVGDSYTAAPFTHSEIDKYFFRYPFDEVLSPLSGIFIAHKNIGDQVLRNQALGSINEIEIRSPYDGQLWGLSHSGKILAARQPLAMIFQGPPTDSYKSFDFRHRAIAGTILREVMSFLKTPV